MITKASVITRMRQLASESKGVRLIEAHELFKDYKGHLTECTEVFKQALPVIEKIRGIWKMEVKYYRFVDHKEVLDKIKITAKPCSAFDSLNKYLVDHCHVPAMKYDDVYFQWVDGKRDNVYVNYEQLLCHDEERCKKYLATLREWKAYSYNIKADFKRYNDYGDRFTYNGEDRECEWQGSCSRVYNISLLTKKHEKVVHSLQLRAY